MSTAVITKRYALALFQIAQKQGQIEKTSQALQALSRAVNNSPPLQKTLTNPATKVTTRILLQLLKLLKAPRTLANLPQTLAKKQRLNLLKPLANTFDSIADENANRLQAVVHSVEPLHPKLQQTLKQKLELMLNKKILLTNKINPQLLGGLTISIGSRVWDGSLKRKLQSLQENFSKTETS